MNDAKVKIGVIGAGRMGVKHIQKLLENPRAEFVGFVEPDAETARTVSMKFNTPAIALTDLFFEADAAIIASSTRTHFTVAKASLEAGLHILVEKPITETPETAKQLVDLAEKNNLTLSVGHIERFRFLELSRELNLSGIKFIESQRASKDFGREPYVDVVSDLMIHDLDLILFLVGKMPTRIEVVGAVVSSKTFDFAKVFLEFPGGIRAVLKANRVSDLPFRRMEVLTDDVFASLDLANDTVWQVGSGATQNGSTVRAESIDALSLQNDAFLASVSGRKSPSVSGRDALRSLTVIAEIQRQLRSEEKYPETNRWDSLETTVGISSEV